ncbi:hypothetical protein MTY66_50350 [Mycolicibacterium sp. TY66]|uniref:hypothetical protein n=1 Tax=unclassified Mycolicibacterium TaxID=2636767 RepID=UPI001BB3A83C|nr:MULTISPECIES: hypothetical protein [unclassified Mycolicibacterium]BCI83410.1 hypothetical protein MTY66_50350 [Mycolicibacterium sp. TY66]BCJ78946.1 hypothetical protein MTY81_03190 [Mycolicibacterium sp. TY81]
MLSLPVKIVGTVLTAVALAVVSAACSNDSGAKHSGGASAARSVTCDEYAQKEYAPARIGGESQSTDISELLDSHKLPQFDLKLNSKVKSAVEKFCGKPSPKGGQPAKRNNSRPINDAVDWDQLS